ncbi:MAG: TonB-dependent receptor [Caulobacterales bacterium]
MKRELFCGASAATVAILTTLWASPGLAATATAAAAAEATSPTTVGELVVSAEKREQRLETVPVAVSAYTAEQRDLLGIKSVQDLTDFTPGLSYTTFSNRPYIRGIGRQSDNLAVESGVAVYSDGVYNGANASTILQLSSLFTNRIEVLRGPQSTLYGRNADGGAINYISNRPTKSYYAEVRAGAADYSKYFVEGVVSGPITDNLRFRIGGNYTKQTGGYYHNLTGQPEGGSVAQGGNGVSWHYEAQLEGNFGSNFDWWAKAAVSDYSVTFHTQTELGPLDTQENSNLLFPNQNYGLCALPGGGGGIGCAGNPDTIVPGSVVALPGTAVTNPTATSIRTFNADFKSNSNQGKDEYFATTETYHFPGVDLKYLFGYQYFYYNLIAPWTNSEGISSSVEQYALQGPAHTQFLCGLFFANAGCTQNLVVNPAKTNFTFIENESFFSHELNLSSTGSGPAQWIMGLYWYHEHYDQPINVNDPSQAQVQQPLLLSPFGALGAPNPTRSVYNEDTILTEDSYAGFGQVDWQVDTAWKLTAGMRYTHDQKVGNEHFRVILFNLEAFGLGVNTFGANTPAWDATACNGPYSGAGPCSIGADGRAVRTLSASWNAVTGTAGVAFTPDATTLGYFKYSRGYKTGGFNSGTMAAFPETAPETVDAFELGMKKTVGSVFQANGALFFDNYFNDQQPLTVPQAGGLLGSQIFNLPQVQLAGLELETILQPIDGLTLGLNYAYLSAKITNMKGICIEDTDDPQALDPQANIRGCPIATGGAPQLQNLTGQNVPLAPHNKITLDGTYTMKFDPGSLSISATYVWKDAQYNSPFNRSYNRSPAYSQVNLTGTWKDSRDRFNIIVFCDNVFNTLGYDATNGIGVTPAGPHQVIDKLVSLTAPRTVGVEFQARFK